MTTSKAAKFWDRMAEGYAKKPVSDQATYEKKLAITRSYLHPDMEVLEFGCGTGSTAIAHAPYVKHILATDISPKMIEIARAKAEDENVQNVTFEQATLESYKGSDRTWDVVLGLNILHLQSNWKEVIAQVYQMLKPGGVFVSSTICIGDTMGILKLVAPIGSRLGLIPQLAIFKIGDLESAFAATGFEIDHQWQPGQGKAVFIVAQK